MAQRYLPPAGPPADAHPAHAGRARRAGHASLAARPPPPPLYIRIWRSPDGRVGDLRFAGDLRGCSTVGALLLLLLLPLVACGLYADAKAGTLLEPARIPQYLVTAAALCAPLVLWWRGPRRPGCAGELGIPACPRVRRREGKTGT